MAGGVDYRQIQAPEQVRTDLPDNGAAARAEALRQTFKEFEGISSDVLNKVQTHAGALAGAAAGNTGSPQYKQGFARLTAYGRAFNNAATGAYAVEAEAQADDAATSHRIAANNNPDTFRTTYSAVRDAVLKTAPADAVPMLTELYNKHLAAGIAAIRGDQLIEQKQLQTKTWDEGVERQTSRVATLQGSENPQDQLRALDEQVKLSLLIDGGVTSGLYSPAMAQAMHINAARSVTAQVLETNVNRILANPDVSSSNADMVKFMDRFRQAHLDNVANTNEPTVFSEKEFQDLMQKATTKIREQRLLDMMLKQQGKSDEQLRFEAGDRQYTSLYLEHKLTASALDAAVRSGDIHPERATGLYNAMANGPVLKSDPNAYLSALRDPRLLDMKPDELAALPGISNPDKIKLGQEAERQRNTWEGQQWAKDAKGAISAALKVPPGSFLVSDDQKKAVVNATQDYIMRMNALDPAVRHSSAASVAQDVIKAEHQREAAAQAAQAIGFRQNALRDHGPGSSQPWDDKKLQARLKQYDDQIAVFSAQAKGQ